MPFERTFFHSDWVDGEDLVQAESDNGFNVRFHQIEDDLDALGRYVNGALLGDRVVSFVPDFSLTGFGDATPGWMFAATGQAEIWSGQNISYGFLPLILPDGATIKELRVSGYVAASTEILFKLFRLPHIHGSDRERLTPITSISGEKEFVEEPYPILAGENNIVNNGTYSYFLTAEGWRSDHTLTVSIKGVSIVYTYDR
jgi:hypothetical protein